MKILKIDRKLNELAVVPESLDDLWHLEKIIEKGDVVSGSTDRKIKPKKEGEKAERIKLFVELQVEDVQFQEFSENLRIGGVMIGGKPEEFIELNSHQSLEVKAGDRVKITKKAIKAWQVERLRKAEKESATAKLLVVLMDDERAELAFVNQFSISKKASIKSDKRGKQYAEQKSDYFDEVLKKAQALEPKKILVAGPGFVKENFKKFVDDKKIKNFPKIFIEGTNSIGETGFRELVSQGKLGALEKEIQLSQESKIIEEFLAALAKGKAEYGREQINKALEAGAVEKLIVAETYLMQHRKEAEETMDAAEGSGSETYIISSKNPQEKVVNGMGGIVAVLRYKME